MTYIIALARSPTYPSLARWRSEEQFKARGSRCMIGRASSLTGLVVVLLTVALTPASAETVPAAWDSYFYASPRATARVLDEVQRAVPLEVRSCDEGWCQVGYGGKEGYVREIVVNGPRNNLDRSDTMKNSMCFNFAQPGGNAWQTERVCNTNR